MLLALNINQYKYEKYVLLQLFNISLNKHDKNIAKGTEMQKPHINFISMPFFIVTRQQFLVRQCRKLAYICSSMKSKVLSTLKQNNK